jgi:hypothetical protein
MKRSWVLVFAVAVALAGNGLYTVWARADGPKPGGCPAKVGKFVLIHDRVSNSALPVERADVQVIGGKPFLVGVGATGARVRTPATGQPVWISLDDAVTVIHFDSIEELEKAVDAAPPPHEREH